MNRQIVFSLSAALFISARVFAADNSIPEATPETFVGGAENLRLVTAATSITAFRIIYRSAKPVDRPLRVADPEQTSKRPKLVTIDGCECDDTPSVVRGAEVTQVIDALSDMANFGGAFMCDFDPGVILRFAVPERTLDLIICFRCQEMVLYGDGAVIRRPYKWASTKNSFRRGAYHAFVALAKKAFPNDANIKGLKQ